MTRKKKLFLNTGSAIVNQLVNLVCGFILPRLIISNYGSATNGLVTSITQYLAFFAMMEMGVGAVVRSSLYKPLAENDGEAISRVLISSKRFFSRLGVMLCVYSIALMIYFPLSVDHSIGYGATAILVGAIAFSSVSNYLFGIVYQQLLNADQRSYVQLSISALTMILNTLFGVILINMDAPIQSVKLLAALVLLLRPLLLKVYVDRHYQLNFKLKLEGEPIKQKWNGLAQHIAQYILKHADTVILTMFSTLENVSIYYVYHLVTNGLLQLIEILTTGFQALLGNMLAKNETERLNRSFSAYELLIHTAVTLLYSTAGVLILPFVSVYTKGVHDANYLVPVFAVLIVAANGVYCLRLPYNTMVLAAGHFKETQWSAIIEAAMNVVISIALVYKFGLVGVAIGTFAAMFYRTCYFAWYLSCHIINRKLTHYIKHLIVDVVVILLILIATKSIKLTEVSWFAWVIMAVKVGFISVACSFAVNILAYRNELKDSFSFALGKKRKQE